MFVFSKLYFTDFDPSAEWAVGLAASERNDELAQYVADFIFESKDPDGRFEELGAGFAMPSKALDREATFALMQIPEGETRTYSEVAAMIGRPKAVRAVASAIGRNEVSFLVPCHRVVRSDGSLGGYRWGLDVKKALLEFERKRSISRG